MRIRIIKPGLLSTVQDLGRNHYLSQAIPVSGAMDSLSARIANLAVENEARAAVIEFTFSGAKFIAETAGLIAYSGEGAVLKAGDQLLPANRPVYIPLGEIIEFIHHPAGSRTYLAVAGGWNVPEILGSRSTFITAALGGKEGRALQSADVLESCGQRSNVLTKKISSLVKNKIHYPKWSIAKQLFLTDNTKRIRVVAGREFNWFDTQSVISFLFEPYTLTNRSNRMGLHLEGSLLNRIIKEELLSTAVAPGTIQVSNNGSMILLMADCQTTGGYPRVAQVAAVDLPLCAQLKPGDQIYFEVISRQEAEMLYLDREQQLRQLETVIRKKWW